MRCVTLHQVMLALARGREVGPPELHESNCWRMVYRDFVAGDDISVVAELEKLKMGEYLLTVTVMHHGKAAE
jgi:hypothetical protein